RVVASADDSGVIRFWRPSGGEAMPALPAPAGGAAPVRVLAFGVLLDREVLAVGRGDRTLQVWALPTGPLLEETVLPDVPRAVSFDPPDGLQVGVGTGELVRIKLP